MSTAIRLEMAGLAAALLLLHGSAWATNTGPKCNGNDAETGANSVVSLQGQGNFSCGQISGDTSVCLNGSCTMQSVPGFQYQVQMDGSRRFITWSAPQQVDAIFVTGNGNGQGGLGSRCLYDFQPGATGGSFLEPAAAGSPTVVACTDGVDGAPPAEKPISTVTNCEEALPTLQSSLDTDGNLISAIGIGTDQGLSGEGDTDGDYIVAVCSAGGQEQCLDQCREPTTKAYACSADAGEQCLSARACATSDETPTGDADAPKYCWEYSHQVDVAGGTFIAPKEKETGAAYWEQYSGSTCVKVTTSYRGRTYSYWSPTGCP